MQAVSDDRRLPALRKIGHKSLKQEVTERVKAAIYAGELKPGERVTELGLAAKVGVGQATIREALIELEHEGYIERRGPRKTYVTSLTQKQIEDIYTVRLPLELLAVRMTAARKGEGLEGADRACRAMTAAAEAGDTNTFYLADLEFHRTLWAATGNTALAEVFDHVAPKVFAFGMMQHVNPGREHLAKVAREHEALLELIRAGDGEKAAQLAEESLVRSRSEDAEMLGQPEP